MAPAPHDYSARGPFEVVIEKSIGESHVTVPIGAKRTEQRFQFALRSPPIAARQFLYECLEYRRAQRAVVATR